MLFKDVTSECHFKDDTPECRLLQINASREMQIQKKTAFLPSQITDKGFRTKVLSPLSYFTRKLRYGII